jgi:putative oxidoreductase
MIKRIAELYRVLEKFPLCILQFLFRFCIAMVFWNAGLVKIQSWQPTVALFANEYRVPLLSPEIAAMLAAAVELTCPVLLVFGLATRLATLPMLGMTLVIQTFVYPDLWLIHLTWATILLFILTRGPGAISLDHLILNIADFRAHRRERSEGVLR